MLAICINYRKSLFFIFACRNGNKSVILHSEISETTLSKDKTSIALKISHRLKSKADAYRQKVLYYFVVNP